MEDAPQHPRVPAAAWAQAPVVAAATGGIIWTAGVEFLVFCVYVWASIHCVCIFADFRGWISERWPG